MRLKLRTNIQGGTLIELIVGIAILGIGLMGIINTINYVLLKSAAPVFELMRVRTFDAVLRDTYANGASYIPSTLPTAANTNLSTPSYVVARNMTISGPATPVIYASSATSCPSPNMWATVTISTPGSGGLTMNACVGPSP